MTPPAAQRDLPTLLHVTIYRFGRRHHPALFRHIVGLAPHFRSVVLSGTNFGYYPESHPDDERVAAAAGIAVHPLPQGLRTLDDPEALAAIAAGLESRHGRIDAVIGHLNGAARAVHLGARLSAPVLATFHGNDANFELTDARHGPAYARLRRAPAARYLAVSESLADRLRAFGMPAERTFVHHLGLDLERFRLATHPPRGRAPRIAMVGSFRRPKGHELAIRGFAQFIRDWPGASLHLYGLGNVPEHYRLRDELVALAERLGLAASVHFHGAVPVDELPVRLADADIALQPSIFVPEDRQVEGLPNAILEAMAAGLPVVATRHGGIPEAVLHEGTGLLVDEHDVAGLAAALARLAADPELAARLGRAGRARVEAEFEIGRQCAGLAGHLHRMIADYGAMDPAARDAAWRA